MASGNGISEPRLRSDQNLQESRIGIDEVPKQISRIFFGKGVGLSDSRPSYSDTYQAPSYQPPSYQPPINNYPGGQQFAPAQFSQPYIGYNDDIFLLIKLGEAALIVFIILAIVVIIYLLATCCLFMFRKDGNKRREQDRPYTIQLQDQTGPKEGGFNSPSQPATGLGRTRGMDNIAGDTDSSLPGSPPHSRTAGRRRSGSRGRDAANRRTKDSDTSLTDRPSMDGIGREPASLSSSRTTSATITNNSAAIHSPVNVYSPTGSLESNVRPNGRSVVGTNTDNGNSSGLSQQNRSLTYYEVPSPSNGTAAATVLSAAYLRQQSANNNGSDYQPIGVPSRRTDNTGNGRSFYT